MNNEEIAKLLDLLDDSSEDSSEPPIIELDLGNAAPIRDPPQQEATSPPKPVMPNGQTSPDRSTAKGIESIDSWNDSSSHRHSTVAGPNSRKARVSSTMDDSSSCPMSVTTYGHSATMRSGGSSSGSTDVATRERTVYINRLDPKLTEGALRDFLDVFGTVMKVRLCGTDVGRTQYGFVEYQACFQAQKLIEAVNRGVTLGSFTVTAVFAKRPILDSDPANDALVDPKRGLIRGCLFGFAKK